MKKFLLLWLLLAASAFGANVDVQKVSGTNAITAPLLFPTGITLEFASGSTLLLDSGSSFTPGAGTIAYSALKQTPTTLAGYGITDPIVLTTGTYSDPAWITSLSASKLTTGTLPVAQLPALTGGDVTSAAGNGTLTLALTGVGAGSVGSGTAIPVLTFDAKGRATVKSTATVTPAWSNITGTPTTAAGYGITNGAAIDTWGTKTPPTGAIVGTTDAQALTNKSYEGLTFAASTGFTITGGGKVLTVGNTGSVSGTNTGDQTITLTGDATGSGTGSFAVNVGKLNGISLGSLATGLLKNTTASGIPSIAVAGTDYDLPVIAGTGLTRSTNTLSVNASQSITSLSNLTTNGFVKTSGGTGALSVDTNTYITGNQTITVSGDVTGSGTTAITAALANIPSGVPAAGSILHTNIAAPATPAAGKTYVYTDSTSKNLAMKNDAGVVNHGVQTKSAVSHQFITSIADDGSSVLAQPAFTDLSGSVAATQMPALTGDATSTAGTVATTVGKVNGVTYGASPGTNTVPVVTSSNTVTYEAVPNTALANSAITIQGSAVSLGGAALATSSTPQFARLGLGATADATAQVLAENDTVASTSTDGVIVKNGAAATVGAQKWSPRLRFSGSGWQTNTSASQTVDFIEELRPVQGSANPTGKLYIASQVNGGGFTDQLSLDSNGNLVTTGTIGASNLSLGGTLTTTGAVSLNQALSTSSTPQFQRLGIGTASLSNAGVYSAGAVTATSGNAYAVDGDGTLTAAANSDKLQFLAAAPAGIIATGTFTGLNEYGLHVYNPTTTGTGTIANAYDIYLETPTVGAANYAIYGAGGKTTLLGGIDATPIGANTPSTGAFTTGSFGSSGLQIYFRSLSAVNRIDSYDNPITTTKPLNINSSLLTLQIADATVGQVTSTGLNSCAIGATTPSTGAFTTLSTTLTNSGAASTGITLVNTASTAGSGINIDFDPVNTSTLRSRIQMALDGGGSGVIKLFTGSGATAGFSQDASGNCSFAGSALSSSPTAGIGYTTGAGGTVTQATSRTTGVTLNTVTGTITLVSAAGSATYQTFTVTDSACGATDFPRVIEQSGTDKYLIMTTNVSAGSFQVTFATTGGTTTEQPVFRFIILKSSNS